MATIKQNNNKLSSKSLTRRAKASDEKALVVWGTNLGSAVGLGPFTKQESKTVKFPPYQLGVIIGILISPPTPTPHMCGVGGGVGGGVF